MAVRGWFASMRASSERMSGEKEGEGRGGREGCGVLVWVGGRAEVMREAIWARVWGVGSGSMSEGWLARWWGVREGSKRGGAYMGGSRGIRLLETLCGWLRGEFEYWSWRRTGLMLDILGSIYRARLV